MRGVVSFFNEVLHSLRSNLQGEVTKHGEDEFFDSKAYHHEHDNPMDKL